MILEKINNKVRQDDILMKFSRRGGNNQKDRIKNRLREAKRIFGNIE
jgi:predicted pyridoxine 5'-phosphate oxidase superfamily flavin-nucleotide-binding protein